MPFPRTSVSIWGEQFAIVTHILYLRRIRTLAPIPPSPHWDREDRLYRTEYDLRNHGLLWQGLAGVLFMSQAAYQGMFRRGASWLADPIPRPNLLSLANLLSILPDSVTLSLNHHRPRGVGALGRSTRCWSLSSVAATPVDIPLASADFEIWEFAGSQRDALAVSFIWVLSAPSARFSRHCGHHHSLGRGRVLLEFGRLDGEIIECPTADREYVVRQKATRVHTMRSVVQSMPRLQGPAIVDVQR